MPHLALSVEPGQPSKCRYRLKTSIASCGLPYGERRLRFACGAAFSLRHKLMQVFFAYRSVGNISDNRIPNALMPSAPTNGWWYGKTVIRNLAPNGAKFKGERQGRPGGPVGAKPLGDLE
jgi:hypothetical protein